MLVISILLFFALIIITLIIVQIKNKKNVGQKISFLYNQLYIILIYAYYDNSIKKKDILKEEIIDYYSKVVANKNIDKKNQYGQDVKGFILQYYDNNDVIHQLYDIISIYYNKYYSGFKKTQGLLTYLLIILLLYMLYFILK